MGGMGEVYRARDERLHRIVALKVVRADREDRTGVAPEDRLIAEARAAAALRHPNVVEIFDAGKDEGRTYVAMEYIEGKPLRAYVGDASVPLSTRKRWVVDVARALAAAHRAGLIHRDVKPENVLVDREGVARVLDFGLAKRITHDTSAPTADAALETATGRVIGTLSYMAPEQLAGGPPDARWDQYAWGVLAYELLTGMHPRLTVPMPGQTAHLSQTPKMPNEVAPEIPFTDASAIMLAMAPNADRRFASMDAALEALRENATISHSTVTVTAKVERSPPPQPSAPRRWPFVLAIALAVLVGVAIGQLTRRSGASPHETAVTPPTASQTASVIATASVARLPSAIAPATTSAPPSSAAPTRASLPADYGTACQCFAEGGPLCLPNAKLDRRMCNCQFDGWAVLDDGGSDIRYGLGLHNDEPCSGHLSAAGETVKGTLGYCNYVCDTRKFAGVHRTACRGLDTHDGAPHDGTLYCY